MASQADIKRRNTRAYSSWVVRVYCYIRFLIMNMRILEEIEQYLPKDGRILDVGCGFGLFSLYFVSCSEKRTVQSFDRSSGRIQQAQESAARLGLTERVQFEVCDVLNYEFKDEVDAVVMLDLLHHIPAGVVPKLIGHIYDTMSEQGTVAIKEVMSKPWWKMAFTWILDKAMDPRASVNYYSKEQMIEMLEAHGFDVKCHQLLDILPYPHILYICRKT